MVSWTLTFAPTRACSKNSHDTQERSEFYLLIFTTTWRGPGDSDDYSLLLQRSQLSDPLPLSLHRP